MFWNKPVYCAWLNHRNQRNLSNEDILHEASNIQMQTKEQATAAMDKLEAKAKDILRYILNIFYLDKAFHIPQIHHLPYFTISCLYLDL